MRISKGHFFTFVFTISLALGNPLWAQTTINVTTTNDELNGDANISLREAVQSANLGTGAYIINLQAGATYNLTISTLTISRGGMNLTIDGNGAGGGPIATLNGTAIGNGVSPMIRILDQGPSGNSLQITFNDLEITGADNSFLIGGAIAFSGSSNTTDSLTLNNCYIHDNLADIGAGMNTQGVETVNINSSTFANNVAGDFGGAMGVSGANLNLNNSTISTNSADGGGGMYLSGTVLTARSSTITNNSANNGGGIEIFPAGASADMKNSILSGNVATVGSSPNCYNPTADVVPFVSNGFNVLGNMNNCTVSGPQTGDQSGVDNPMLGALADNGGPTPTHAELAGSPAIDNGDPTGCKDASGAVLSFDQRGASFPRAADGDNNGSVICDSGAYEAASTITDVENAIDDLSDYVATIPASDFKNSNMANTFMNKLDAALAQLGDIAAESDPDVKAGLINELKNKLINDILSKTNGCPTTADNNDWIRNCDDQLSIQGMIQDILDLLDQL